MKLFEGLTEYVFVGIVLIALIVGSVQAAQKIGSSVAASVEHSIQGVR